MNTLAFALVFWLRALTCGDKCYMIVDDELGRMPPHSESGPRALAKNGTGLMCLVGRFG